MLPLILLLAAPSSEPVATPTVSVQAAKPVENRWTGSVALNATYSDGNTSRRTIGSTADAEYRRPKDRTTLGFLWNYAQEEGAITDRKTQGRAKYDYFFDEKLYGLVQASAENDLQAGLDLRTTLGVGVGYQFRDTESWKLSGELGVSWVDEDFVTNADDDEYLAGRAAYKWDWKPNEKYTVGQVGEIFPSLENGDDVNARVDTKGRISLTKTMFAQLQWLYQWDNTPAAGKRRVDNLVVLGLGWSF